MDRWIFMRIFMVRDKRPILLRSSRSASPRWWWSAVFTVCFERKYNEFSGVAPPAQRERRGYSSVSRYRFFPRNYSGIPDCSSYPRVRNRFDFSIHSLPPPLPPLRLCLLEMFFNISGARERVYHGIG